MNEINWHSYNMIQALRLVVVMALTLTISVIAAF